MAAYLTSNDVEDRDYEGFSLIELMVVLLIMGILISIAIPTFLGAKGSANDRAAQANIRKWILRWLRATVPLGGEPLFRWW